MALATSWAQFFFCLYFMYIYIYSHDIITKKMLFGMEWMVISWLEIAPTEVKSCRFWIVSCQDIRKPAVPGNLQRRRQLFTGSILLMKEQIFVEAGNPGPGLHYSKCLHMSLLLRQSIVPVLGKWWTHAGTLLLIDGGAKFHSCLRLE